jgi:hypothetical protein
MKPPVPELAAPPIAGETSRVARGEERRVALATQKGSLFVKIIIFTAKGGFRAFAENMHYVTKIDTGGYHSP